MCGIVRLSPFGISDMASIVAAPAIGAGENRKPLKQHRCYFVSEVPFCDNYAGFLVAAENCQKHEYALSPDPEYSMPGSTQCSD